MVYEEIKRKYEREKLEKGTKDDDMSLYHQRKVSKDGLDQDMRSVKYIPLKLKFTNYIFLSCFTNN